MVWVLWFVERPFRPMPEVVHGACQFLKTAEFLWFDRQQTPGFNRERRVNTTDW
jgi:hypothetical protein